MLSMFQFTTDDGLTLQARDYQAPADKPAIICLPGLSRNSRDFHQVALALQARGRRVIALDYRGRGFSQWDNNPANYNIMREAQDVLCLMDTCQIDKADFIGTSRGGLIIYILANLALGRLGRLVLNDIGPVIEMEGLRHIAQYLTREQSFPSWAAVETALENLHGPGFPALSKEDWQKMARALFREIDGKIAADYDPKLVTPLKEMDFSKMLPDLWASYDLLKEKELALIWGEFTDLLSQETIREMGMRHPALITIKAEGQAHAPFLEKEPVLDQLIQFFEA